MANILVKIFSIITSMFLFFESVPGFFVTETEKTDFSSCKNVIFCIGDGMGFNSIEKTRTECGIKEFTMDTFPLKGESETRSMSSSVTDSAAGGTALATGVRTNNNYVGVYYYDPFASYSHPMNLCESAISMGKLAGVITTDKTSGATPSAFSVHVADRGDEEGITFQQLTSCDLTLIWGTATASNNQYYAKEAGFQLITDLDSMNALKGGRSFGQFTDELWHKNQTNGMPTLAQMTAKAIDLLDDDEDGFFLMVEGAHIDKNNHNNEGEKMEDALQSFDAAVKVALDYAKADGNTLVIVTADHETGGITEEGGAYVYTTGSHTGANVPLLVYGCDNFIENGEAIENREVSRRTACVMGDTEFPHQVIVPTAEAAA